MYILQYNIIQCNINTIQYNTNRYTTIWHNPVPLYDISCKMYFVGVQCTMYKVRCNEYMYYILYICICIWIWTYLCNCARVYVCMCARQRDDICHKHHQQCLWSLFGCVLGLKCRNLRAFENVLVEKTDKYHVWPGRFVTAGCLGRQSTGRGYRLQATAGYRELYLTTNWLNKAGQSVVFVQQMRTHQITFVSVCVFIIKHFLSTRSG